MILLIVLGVLVIFSLVVLMFVISARQHKTSSHVQQKVERFDVDPLQQLNLALAELLRGSRNPYSSVGPHGLLEDLYGGDSIPATPSDPSLPVAGGAAIHALDSTGNVTNTASGLLLITVADTLGRLSQQAGYYNGRVLTPLDGPARMHSTRIVGYNYNAAAAPPQARFQVLAFENGFVPQPNDRIVINGREFSGVGFGYDPTTGRTDLKDPDFPNVPAALLPNTAADVNARTVDLAAGGANTSYTAPDNNHLFLAGRFYVPDVATVPDRNGNPVTINPALRGRWVVLQPSFHRPDLLNHFAKAGNAQYGINPSDKFLWRKHTLRPLNGASLATDPSSPLHPGFNNDDPLLKTDLLLNPDRNNNGILDFLEDGQGGLVWDVDNDGDGLVDSVWIDLGLPAQTAPDGRMFKPLFAFLVLDMDNRINLNVHGHNEHANQTIVGPQIVSSQPIAGTRFATLGAQVALPQGQGNSVARVNPRVIFGQAEWAQLLSGVGPTVGPPAIGSESSKDGKNGERDLASSGSPAYPGLTDNARDPSSIVKDPHYPEAYGAVNGAIQLGKPIIDLLSGTAGYGYPVSYGEVSLLGLDMSGQPIRINFGPSNQQEREHPPQFNPYRPRYVSNGNQRKSVDHPFAMAEIEELLRRYDVDGQSLERRLSRLAPSLWNDTPIDRLRQGLVTAGSYDLPVGAPIASKQIRDEMLANNVKPTGNQIMDLVAFKIISETRIKTGGAASNALIAASLPQLLSPELVRGERMNVNPRWANGRDDNGNGIVDEPGEVNATTGYESVWWEPGMAPAAYANFAGVPMNYANGQDLNGDGVYTPADDQFANNPAFRIHAQIRARQLYARHLYVLMMLMVDRGYVVPSQELGGAGNLGSLSQRRYTAQRIAQWAVNVVDYLDPDSISTPFEFDYEPFVDNAGTGSTWNVDGWLGTNPITGQPSLDDQLQFNYATPSANNYRGLVWGCERPPLLLTETFGPHDIRTEDRDDETDDPGMKPNKIGAAMDPDTDLDQKRRPQGSAFIELYNPSHDPVAMEYRSLTLGPGSNGIDLSRLAPPSADGHSRPVFQVVLRRQVADWANKPDTSHLDPQFPNVFKNPPDNADERIVWFTSETAYGSRPDMTVDPRIYYSRLETWNAATPDDMRPDYAGYENKVGFDSTAANMARMCLVAPGGYTVIGSRVKTRIGMTGPAGAQAGSHTILLLDQTANAPQPPANNASNGNAAGRLVADTPAVNYPNWGARAGNSLIKPPAGIVINFPHALSITEPGPGEMYYPTPDDLTTDPDDASIKYRDAYLKVRDQPLDATNQWVTNPRSVTVYLQRLANPLLPWDAQTNPYLTVDAMPMSPVKINGEYAGPYAQNEQVKPDATVHFSTRERIGEADWNLWKQSFSDPDKDPAAGRSPRDFVHSLGYVSGLTNGGSVADRYLAQGGVWNSADFGAGSQYIGDPRSQVFPWFTWNDHPAASHLELMNVPASSPSRLLYEHRLRTNPTLAPFFNQYADRSPSADDHGPNSGPPYGHLLNFFQSSTAAQDAGGQWNVAGTAAGNLFRVFEFLRVPSRFDGSEVIFSPTQFVYPLEDPSGVGPYLPHNFFPPFNRISRYRDPGLININTIADNGLTWQATLDNDGPDVAGNLRNHVHWRKVFLSRQGYGNWIPPNQALVPTLNNDSPTMFANPFRGYADGYNVPIPALQNVNANPAGAAHGLVDATLLRPDPYDPTRPLMAAQTTVDDVVATAAGVDPTGAGDARSISPDPFGNRPYLDGDRNPYFRYDTLRKLGNVITTRSNVYGVWITVGYFEVHQNPQLPRAYYPDGYTLGAELGSDTGEVVRHRIFAVIDRSIPVAFQRGEDYNSQRAVVLKKVIE